MKGRVRHVLIWRILRPLLGPWLRRKFNYTPQPADITGPCLILSNHVTDWDPVLIALPFRRHMYFVASEHIFRWGFLTKLILWAQSPIARLKGSTATDTAVTVMRELRRGHNICIFAEGELTWDGKTCPIIPSTAKLARACGATLVTFKFTGGYFSSPRWSGKGIRRGKMEGSVVGVYPKEKLREFSAGEINELIYNDLYEDAYARQREHPVAFRGDAPAEHLETALCVCPGCGGIDTLKSEKDKFSCSACGLTALYTEQGFLEGEGLPFDSVSDWDNWQLPRLLEHAEGAGSGPIFTDTDIPLSELLPGHGAELFGSGELALYRDRLVCAGEVFPLSEISGMAMHGNKTINLGLGSRNFEIGGGRVFCARKYCLVYEYLKSGIAREA